MKGFIRVFFLVVLLSITSVLQVDTKTLALVTSFYKEPDNNYLFQTLKLIQSQLKTTPQAWTRICYFIFPDALPRSAKEGALLSDIYDILNRAGVEDYLDVTFTDKIAENGTLATSSFSLEKTKQFNSVFIPVIMRGTGKGPDLNEDPFRYPAWIKNVAHDFLPNEMFVYHLDLDTILWCLFFNKTSELVRALPLLDGALWNMVFEKKGILVPLPKIGTVDTGSFFGRSRAIKESGALWGEVFPPPKRRSADGKFIKAFFNNLISSKRTIVWVDQVWAFHNRLKWKIGTPDHCEPYFTSTSRKQITFRLPKWAGWTNWTNYPEFDFFRL